MADNPEDKINKAKEDANALAGVFKQIKEEMRDLSKAMGDSLDPLAGINQNMSAQIKAAQVLNSLSKDDLKAKKTANDLSNHAKKLRKEITGASKIQKDLEKQILQQEKVVAKLNKEGFTDSQLKYNFVGKTLKARAAELVKLKKAKELNERNLANTKALAKEMSVVKAEAEKVNAAGAGFEKMAAGLKKIPIIGGTLSKSFTAAAEKAREVAAEGGKMPKMRGAVSGVKTLVDQFASIPAILSQIIAMMMDLDQNATDLSKDMNMSYEEGLKFNNTLIEAGTNNKDLVANNKALVDSQRSLMDVSGIYHKRSEAILLTHVELTKRLGLSNEEAYRFEKFANASGKNYGKLVKQTKLLGVNLGKNNGLNFNAAKLMKEVANVSAEISSNLGNDPEKIMEAVVAAKLLGTDLKTIEGTLKSMTDFEGSISKELEAELLIGRDLNLERARALSLAGDMTGLAEELKNQVGSEAEWLEMNVIQRQSLADSMGMSVEKMGEMFLTQEEQKALQEEQAELKEKELEANSLQLSLMQELAGMVEKIKDVFKDTYKGPMAKMTLGLKSFFKDGKNIERIFNSVKKIFKFMEFIIRVKMFAGIGRITTAWLTQIALRSAAEKAASIQRKTLAAGETVVNAGNSAAASAGPIALSGGLLIPIIVGGIATIMAAAASYAMFADGGVVPGTGNKDTVPAMLTPGELVLNASQQENVAGAVGGGGDITRLEAVIEKLSNRPNIIKVDDWTLGETSPEASAFHGNNPTLLS